MNRSESIKQISIALLKSQREMGNATKGSINPFYKSKYSDLNAIREASIPVLNENEITVLQPTISIDGRNYVETTLLHSSGEYLSSLTEIISAKANDPQAHGSGMSYSRRYGLQAFLCIGAEDNDAEGAMDRKVNPGAKVSATSPAATTVTVKHSLNSAGSLPVTTAVTETTTPKANAVAAKPGFRNPRKPAAAPVNVEVETSSGDDL